jgi:hypothetical protein
MLDGGDNATAEMSKADADDIEEEGGECEDTDEPESDDDVVVAKLYEAETDWEDDEGKSGDESEVQP